MELEDHCKFMYWFMSDSTQGLMRPCLTMLDNAPEEHTSSPAQENDFHFAECLKVYALVCSGLSACQRKRDDAGEVQLVVGEITAHFNSN